MEYISLIWDLLKKLFDFFTRRQKRLLQIEDEKRKVKQVENEKMRDLLYEMLSNLENLYTAANFAGQKDSMDKVREVSKWFDGACLPFRDRYPFNEFEHLKKIIASYTHDSVLLAPISVEMFEKITQLRIDINELIKELHDK